MRMSHAHCPKTHIESAAGQPETPFPGPSRCASGALGPRGDQYMPRLRGDALEPRTHVRVRSEIELGLVGDVRIGVERYVCDGILFGDEESTVFQMSVHDGKRGSPLREPLRQLRAARRVRRQMPENVSRRRDIRLVAVLLKEHPLQYLCTPEPLAG